MDSLIWKGLPEDIVGNIMEKLFQGLTVKEAVQASVVSRRYHKLWANVSNSLTRLDFEYCFHGTNYDHLHSSHKFMEFVSHSLDSHQGIAVDSLRIAFDTNHLFDDDDDDDDGAKVVENRLANWVRFARNKCVQSLELNLDPSRFEPRKGFRFPMDEFILGLPNLTSLSLNSIDITTHEVTYLLPNCLINLEKLVIENARELKVLIITAPRLKHLEMNQNTFCDINIVSMPNLECIKCLFASSVRLYEAMPKLSNISLCGPFCQDQMSRLQKYAPNLEKLELAVDEFLLGFLCRNFAQLGNVKHLVLYLATGSEADCIMDLMFAVAACPNLQNVTFKCESNDDARVFKENRWHQTSYKHLCLKVVEFVGWLGRKPEVEFANCLVESAVNLERVTFDLNTLPPRQSASSDLEAAVLGAQQVIGRKSNIIAHEIVIPS